jgi:hypothetical protein
MVWGATAAPTIQATAVSGTFKNDDYDTNDFYVVMKLGLVMTTTTAEHMI